MAAIDGLRERKRAHNRATTVDLALALFAERGYDAVTVADICAAAEIAPRTFFRYFGSKEDVLLEPFHEQGTLIARAIDAAPAGWSDGKVLREAIEQVSTYVVANRQRLAATLAVIRAAAVLRTAPVLTLTDRERALAEQLAARRGAAPDWRTRLRVARAVAAYRVWFEDVLTGDVPDPAAHLAEVFSPE